jgi:LEA14-like dessication related protein
MSVSSRLRSGFAVLAVALAACTSLVPRPIAPEVALDSVTAMAIGAQGARARVRLLVRNPNGYDLAAESLDYTLTIDGRRMASGALARPVTLTANAVTPVDLDVLTDLEVLGNSLDRAARRGALPYEIEGEVVLGNGTRLPFRRRGEFNPLRNLLR